MCNKGTACQRSGATRELRTVARADRCEGVVGSVLLDSISAALTLHSPPYFYMDRTGIPQLMALCIRWAAGVQPAQALRNGRQASGGRGVGVVWWGEIHRYFLSKPSAGQNDWLRAHLHVFVRQEADARHRVYWHDSVSVGTCLQFLSSVSVPSIIRWWSVRGDTSCVLLASVHRAGSRKYVVNSSTPKRTMVPV